MPKPFRWMNIVSIYFYSFSIHNRRTMNDDDGKRWRRRRRRRVKQRITTASPQHTYNTFTIHIETTRALPRTHTHTDAKPKIIRKKAERMDRNKSRKEKSNKRRWEERTKKSHNRTQHTTHTQPHSTRAIHNTVGTERNRIETHTRANHWTKQPHTWTWTYTYVFVYVFVRLSVAVCVWVSTRVLCVPVKLQRAHTTPTKIEREDGNRKRSLAIAVIVVPSRTLPQRSDAVCQRLHNCVSDCTHSCADCAMCIVH